MHLLQTKKKKKYVERDTYVPSHCWAQSKMRYKIFYYKPRYLKVRALPGQPWCLDYTWGDSISRRMLANRPHPLDQPVVVGWVAQPRRVPKRSLVAPQYTPHFSLVGWASPIHIPIVSHRGTNQASQLIPYIYLLTSVF